MIIFLFDDYFSENKLKNSILGNFSSIYIYLLFLLKDYIHIKLKYTRAYIVIKQKINTQDQTQNRQVKNNPRSPKSADDKQSPEPKHDDFKTKKNQRKIKHIEWRQGRKLLRNMILNLQTTIKKDNSNQKLPIVNSARWVEPSFKSQSNITCSSISVNWNRPNWI